VRCNEIQGAQGVENAEATSLASGRNADGSDARYFFADARSSSPPVESSNSAALATRRNSFRYSVTDRLPCFMFFSLILVSPLASITPNCPCNSALNPAQLSHAGVIRSSAYGVIQVPASSLRRLVA